MGTGASTIYPVHPSILLFIRNRSRPRHGGVDGYFFDAANIQNANACGSD
jgi:hypothetical protein